MLHGRSQLQEDKTAYGPIDIKCSEWTVHINRTISGCQGMEGEESGEWLFVRTGVSLWDAENGPLTISDGGDSCTILNFPKTTELSTFKECFIVHELHPNASPLAWDGQWQSNLWVQEREWGLVYSAVLGSCVVQEMICLGRKSQQLSRLAQTISNSNSWGQKSAFNSNNIPQFRTNSNTDDISFPMCNPQGRFCIWFLTQDGKIVLTPEACKSPNQPKAVSLHPILYCLEGD